MIRPFPDVMDIYGSEPPDEELEREAQEAYDAWVESEIDRMRDEELEQ